MRDDLYELVSELKLHKFFLAGHSMGGKVAISFALKWPEMLNGLIIADISPFENDLSTQSGYNLHLEIINAILSIDIGAVSTRDEVDLLLSEKISSGKIRGLIMKNLQRNAKNGFSWKINTYSLLNNLDKIMEGLDREAAFTQQITGFPVIFLKGADSDYLPAADYPDIRKVFPAAEFVEVSNAGHWIHSDRPDEVIKNLKNLLSDS